MPLEFTGIDDALKYIIKTYNGLSTDAKGKYYQLAESIEVFTRYNLSAELADSRAEEVGIVVDYHLNTACMDGKKARFTPMEFKVFIEILKRKEKPIKISTLIRIVYENASLEPFNSEKSIQVCVCKIRSKIRKLGLGISNSERSGYLLFKKDDKAAIMRSEIFDEPLEIKGETKNIGEWLKIYGTDKRLFYNRYFYYGWDAIKAVKNPYMGRVKSKGSYKAS